MISTKKFEDLMMKVWNLKIMKCERILLFRRIKFAALAKQAIEHLLQQNSEVWYEKQEWDIT